jgi:hypothetical protein
MVTRNALKLALCLALGIIAPSFASESGKLASRAQASLKAGKFAKGYSQLERALIASRREADIKSEIRIFIAMAQVRTMSLDFDFADSLLSNIHYDDALDTPTKTMLIKAKMGLGNATEKYGDAVTLCESISEDELDNLDDELQGVFYSECAIAYAGAHREDKAQQALKMVGKRLDDDTGIYYWTKARTMDLQGKNDADMFYHKAESESVKSHTAYTTANIVYHRAKYLKKTNPTASKSFFERCKTAFELMGLQKNSARCTE